MLGFLWGCYRKCPHMSTKSFSIHWNLKSQFPNTCFLPFARRCSLNAFPLSFFHCPRIHSPKPYLPQPPLVQSNPYNQTPHDVTQARESISEYLQELGLSLEDSISISSNSPKYVQMLVDGVKELEEWNAWNDSNGEGDSLGFKEMIIYMAKEKGDNGKVAFLESVGLPLSSAMSVARYLSSESLPSIIRKVKYMKENIFSAGDDKGGLSGKNARRMMMHLSISSDEDVQQTLSFFEKIEARRGGLEILGLVDATFRFLLESFPRLLLLPVESHLEPMVEFLENIGVPRRSMGNVFLLFPPILFYKIQGIKSKFLTFEKVGAAYKDIGKMLLKYPWILSTSIQENYEQILLFFEEEKIPKTSVDRAIRSWPHLLGCSTSKLKLMVDQFGELGIRNKKFGRVIAKSPQLLLKKPQEFLQVVLFFEELGLAQETVGKLVSRCPEVFAANIDTTLKKKVELLAEFGISNDHLPRVIKKYPEVLVSDVNKTLLPRINYLMEMGLSRREIALMIRRFPPLLGYSIKEVLKPKLNFLLNTIGKPVKDVVGYPRYFSYSLEKKIKPRFWVLKGKNIECSLEVMLGKNDEEFAATAMEARRRNPITLVLDLDETLVHSTLEPCDDADFTFTVFFNMKEHTVFVKQRPHLHKFLEKVAEMFEVVIFTASQSIYAEQLLDILDPDRKLISRRVYRESCIFSDGSYTKDLTVLGVDLAKVAIIDNSPQVYRLQVNNGIPIKSWFDDPSDCALISLLPFLETLVDIDDVRPVIAKKFGNKE